MTSTAPNVGFLDRLLRILLATGLILACYLTKSGGPLPFFGGLAAAYAFVTSLTGYCQIYAVFDRSTYQQTEP